MNVKDLEALYAYGGQVALLLRLLGQTPGNFDILFYYEEQRAGMA